MKNVITAIGNSNLNEKCREMENCLVVVDDITEDESIIEWVEREKDVDVLFLNSNIVKNYSLEEFIDILHVIQEDMYIVIFGNQDIEINSDKVKVYDSFNIDEEELNNILNMKENIRYQNNIAKTIAISGANGIGKSTFSTFLAKNVESQDKKTLLIDFDIDEHQIRTLLKIKKKPQFSDNINDMIVNIKKNVDVLCYLDFIFNKENLDFFDIQKLLNSVKKDYDLIIIDTSSNLGDEYTRKVFYNCDDIFFLVEPNILGIKKAKLILEFFQNDWNISNNKISLILNKSNMYQISENIIHELFPDLKILGKMKYLDSYNLMINKDVNKREIRREYEKICKKIVM